MTEKRVIKISPSGLNRIQTCFRASYYNRILGYELPEEQQSEAMTKGTIIHTVLEHYYKSIISGVEKRDQIQSSIILLKEEMEKTSLDNQTKAHLTTTMMEYFGFYANDLYKPVFVEQPFSYELYEDDERTILLEGKIDLGMDRVQGDETLHYVFDHKSRGRDTTPIALNNQYMGYALATGINNVVDNQIGLQTSLKTQDKYKRRILSYSPEQLEEFSEWAIYWVLMFDTAIQKSKEYGKDHYPPNYSNCYSCQFRPVCESNKEMREEKLQRFYVKRNEDYDIFGEKK